MTDQQIKSWILLATSIASQMQPTDFAGISMIADGLNHAIPTHKEIQSSMLYFIQRGFVEKTGSKYFLTPKGKLLITNATQNEEGYRQTLKRLEGLL